MSVNLLPPQHKADIVYARRNTILRNWIIASCIGVAGILIVLAAGHFFIDQSTKSAQRQVTEMHKQLDAQNQAEVEKQVTSISNSVKLALQVLQRQIFFSKLIQQVGAVMPAGTSLESLSISSTQGAIDLSAIATDYQTATQIQINLTDPSNKLFEKADINSISCDNQTTAGCTVSIRALFAKDNSFQYAKTTAGGTK